MCVDLVQLHIIRRCVRHGSGTSGSADLLIIATRDIHAGMAIDSSRNISNVLLVGVVVGHSTVHQGTGGQTLKRETHLESESAQCDGEGIDKIERAMTCVLKVCWEKIRTHGGSSTNSGRSGRIAIVGNAFGTACSSA